MDKDITLEQEFDLVFKAHYSLVKNFALMLLKSGQDADDIASSVSPDGDKSLKRLSSICACW